MTDTFDIKRLTGAELILAEKLCGGDLGTTAGTYASYFVWQKRGNPKMTFDQALEVELGVVMEALGIEVPEDPKA
jgi:hypothetical protein